MTRGPILQLLIAFALPLMLGNVFQMLYNTVDSVIVGNFVSKQALGIHRGRRPDGEADAASHAYAGGRFS